MKKNMAIVALISFMFVFSLQMVEPAAAAAKLKAIDKGSIAFNTAGGAGTYTWTTYQKGTNYVEIRAYAYVPNTKRGVYTYIYLEKVSSTKLKMSGKAVFKDYKTGTSSTQTIKTQYINTKLTAAQYYWKQYRPDMISGIKNPK